MNEKFGALKALKSKSWPSCRQPSFITFNQQIERYDRGKIGPKKLYLDLVKAKS